MGASLQALTIEALVNDPQLLKKFILNTDERGFLTVRHLSIDSIQVLLNNGELGLLCNWMNAAFDEFVWYLNAKPVEVNYHDAIHQLIQPQKTFV